MVQILNAGGEALGLFAGLMQGAGNVKQQNIQNQQNQQKLALAERQVALDEAYQKGREETFAKLEQQEIAMLEMDFLRSEGLGDKNMLKGRGGAAAAMGVAGQVFGGVPAAQTANPQLQKMQADVARWNETFKALPAEARGALLNDMAAVKDQQIEQQRFKKTRELLLQKVQVFRGTEGQFEEVDEGLQQIRKMISEAESPQELDLANQALDELRDEGDTRATNAKSSKSFQEWSSGMQARVPDRNNIAETLAREVARGGMTEVQATWKYLEQNSPEAFRASKADVTRQAAREHALKVKGQAFDMAMESFGGMPPEDPMDLHKRVRDFEQYLSGGGGQGGRVAPGTSQTAVKLVNGQPPLIPPGKGPLTGTQAAQLGLSVEEGWKRAQAAEGGSETSGFEAEADADAMPGAESQQEYEGVLVQMVRLAKASRGGNKAAGKAVVDLAVGLDEWAGSQLPMVFKDLEMAAKEAGLPGITAKKLRDAAEKASDEGMRGGGLLSEALRLIRGGGKTQFPKSPY